MEPKYDIALGAKPCSVYAETISRGFTQDSISLACEKQYRSEHPRQAIKTMQLFLHCQHQLWNERNRHLYVINVTGHIVSAETRHAEDLSH
jgi:hypothetical protein